MGPFTVKEPSEAPAGSGFAPPMMSFPDGCNIAQTNVLVAVVGKQCGLAPDDFNNEAKAKQLAADAGDLMVEVLEPKPAERLTKWLNYVESQLQGTYFLGDKLTFVDFAFYMVMECIRLKQEKGKLEGVVVPPKLQSWFSETMLKVAVVKELNDSGVAMWR